MIQRVWATGVTKQQQAATDSNNRQLREHQFRLLLVAAPWALFNRPSLQLAALRSYLVEQGGFHVDNRHLYLAVAKRIGTDLYARIARSGWAGEALFTPLLFPEQTEGAARLFRRELAADGDGAVPAYEPLVAAVRDSCDEFVSGIDWTTFSLVGFSVCFNQLLGSLYLAERIKRAEPPIPVAFGGTSCAGTVGQKLVEQFDQIDYLVGGEGERPLQALCQHLAGGGGALPAQIRSRSTHRRGPPLADIARLDDLPIPDFRPYLAEVRHHFAGLPFQPVLPVEFSRGCTWRRCTFCNLNLQWQGYRSKSATRMIEEVIQVCRQNETLHCAFTDNVLPARQSDAFFQAMAAVDEDYGFFGELRAKTSAQRLRRFRTGGLRCVQVGIEALSSSLLARMGKGTSAMDNLVMMKNCLAAGVELKGNLIIEFPGTTAAEIDETLVHLDYALPFAPLDPASFFLGHDSPIHRHYREYGIRAVGVHPKTRLLFPPRYRMISLVCGYSGDRRLQRRQWRPVRQKLRQWRAFHRQRAGRNEPPLYYRDGGTFLIINQELPRQPPLLHRLRGLSRELYLFCAEPQSRPDIYRAFSDLRPAAIDHFFAQLSEKRLVFCEADRVLALAVRYG